MKILKGKIYINKINSEKVMVNEYYDGNVIYTLVSNGNGDTMTDDCFFENFEECVVDDPIKQNRVGRISISDFLMTEHHDLICMLMRKMVVARAEFFYHKSVIKYTAYSEYFDVVLKGQTVPKYDIIFDRTGENTTIKFIMVD